jgi:hypothetical protein
LDEKGDQRPEMRKERVYFASGLIPYLAF